MKQKERAESVDGVPEMSEVILMARSEGSNEVNRILE